MSEEPDSPNIERLRCGNGGVRALGRWSFINTERDLLLRGSVCLPLLFLLISGVEVTVSTLRAVRSVELLLPGSFVSTKGECCCCCLVTGRGAEEVEGDCKGNVQVSTTQKKEHYLCFYQNINGFQLDTKH